MDKKPRLPRLDVAVTMGGEMLPLGSGEARAIGLDLLRKGRVVAVIVMSPEDRPSVHVFGEGDEAMAAMEEAVVAWKAIRKH